MVARVRRRVRWIALPVLAAAGAAAVSFGVTSRRAYARIAGKSIVLASPFGDIEYARGGSGPPVLVVHGSGGGYDQGELVATAILGDGFEWVAPSRFGYLRSTVASGATFEDQARAYAHLLDALGLHTVGVIALSHGGPSALLFAAMYPERVSSLTLLSCGVASSTAAAQADANRKGDTLTLIFKYDVLYWGVSTFLRTTLMRLMGASDDVVARLAPDQRALVDQVIDGMMPVAPRYAGVAFDNRAAMPNERVRDVRAPTLIVHARDDALQLYHNAESAAARIPGARLMAFDRGGHLLIAVEQQAIRDEVRRFVLAHVESSRSSGALDAGSPAPESRRTGDHTGDVPSAR